MEKLATDIYTFEDLIRNGFTYVDKTDRLLPLVDMTVGLAFSKAKRTIVAAKVEEAVPGA